MIRGQASRLLLSLAVLLAGAPLVAGCGGSGANQRGSLAPAELRRQLAAYQQGRLHQRQFFVGLAEGRDLQQATHAAFRELSAQLSWLPPRSPELLQGLYRVDRSATDNQGQLHVLAVLEREAAAAFLKQRAHQLEEDLQQRLVSCRESLQAGDVVAAQQCLSEVERELEQVKALLSAAQAALGDRPVPHALSADGQATELRRELEARMHSKKVVLLRVLQLVEQQPERHLDEPFAELLQQRGYKHVICMLPDQAVRQALAGQLDPLLVSARAAGSGLSLIGQVEARFSSEVSGQFFSHAAGVVRLIETASGRVVMEASVQGVKGGHLSQQRACQQAVQNAVKQLQRKVAAALAPAGSSTGGGEHLRSRAQVAMNSN